jgi:hypothetical protein
MASTDPLQTPDSSVSRSRSGLSHAQTLVVGVSASATTESDSVDGGSALHSSPPTTGQAGQQSRQRRGAAPAGSGQPATGHQHRERPRAQTAIALGSNSPLQRYWLTASQRLRQAQRRYPGIQPYAPMKEENTPLPSSLGSRSRTRTKQITKKPPISMQKMPATIASSASGNRSNVSIYVVSIQNFKC